MPVHPTPSALSICQALSQGRHHKCAGAQEQRGALDLLGPTRKRRQEEEEEEEEEDDLPSMRRRGRDRKRKHTSTRLDHELYACSNQNAYKVLTRPFLLSPLPPNSTGATCD